MARKHIFEKESEVSIGGDAPLALSRAQRRRTQWLRAVVATTALTLLWLVLLVLVAGAPGAA